MNLGEMTAVETAEAVRTGKISALEVCDATIDRIEAADGPINAVVVRDFDRARAAAKALDANGAKGSDKLLIGVSMTVKESNNVAGLPTTWGFPDHANNIVDKDSVVVSRLKAAGAVIVGKTNAPVALADWQSGNPIYGNTVNPIDHSRTPGGSSGGASAALAAKMTPLEIGSDIGGSIRVPAHFCGVYGHKPTFGLVPGKGHDFPGTDSLDSALAVVGPMARSAKDLSLTMDVIAGPAEPGMKPDLIAPRFDTLADTRVLVMTGHPLAKTASAVSGAIRQVASDLMDEGTDIAFEGPTPDLIKMHQTYVDMLTTVISRATPDPRGTTAHEWMDLMDEQMRVTRTWQELFADFDVVLAPTLGVTAFPLTDEPDWNARHLMIDGEKTRFGEQLVFAGLATFPGLPSTAVPLGKDEDGLPTGVQIMGPPFGDRITLGFAEQLAAAGLTM